MINNRKPAHLEQLGGLNKRERIWLVIRRLKTFTVSDIQGEMNDGMPRRTIHSYLKGLEAAGYIEQTGTKSNPVANSRIFIYRLIHDCGIEAPRVRLDGSEVTQGRGREQLWRTLKILKEFNGRELAIAASTEAHPVKEAEASKYVEVLHHAGYLILAEPSKPGKQARYRFNPRKNTGPKPPMIQRLKTVYDPNLGKIVWQQEVNHELA